MEHSVKKISSFHRLFFSRLVFIVMAGVACFLMVTVVRAYYQDYRIRAEIARMENDLGELKQKKIESLELLSYVLSSDFVEERARSELNMKKPGEHVLIVKEHPGEVIAEPVAAAPSGQPTANPIKWWYYFTHQELDADT